eukprot:SAG22_NODE_14733_length_366_cov_1.183521_1_plen_27_part_10
MLITPARRQHRATTLTLKQSPSLTDLV